MGDRRTRYNHSVRLNASRESTDESLTLRFENDGDGTGKLLAKVSVNGFAARARHISALGSCKISRRRCSRSRFRRSRDSRSPVVLLQREAACATDGASRMSCNDRTKRTRLVSLSPLRSRHMTATHDSALSCRRVLHTSFLNERRRCRVRGVACHREARRPTTDRALAARRSRELVGRIYASPSRSAVPITHCRAHNGYVPAPVVRCDAWLGGE